MIFDATDGTTGDHGHVHCRLAWSPDALTNWSWVDPGELGGKGHMPGREFIPAGPAGSFDSHVCFAAHMPLKMPDGSSRIYYMGGNGKCCCATMVFSCVAFPGPISSALLIALAPGPHSGKRNSSFALATLPADRFAGLKGTGEVETKSLTVTGSKMTITADVESGGSISVSVVGHGTASKPIAANVTDGEVSGLELSALVGKQVQLKLALKDAAVYTVGFAN